MDRHQDTCSTTSPSAEDGLPFHAHFRCARTQEGVQKGWCSDRTSDQKVGSFTRDKATDPRIRRDRQGTASEIFSVTSKGSLREELLDMLCSSEVDSPLGVIEGGATRLQNHERGGKFTLQIMHTQEENTLLWALRLRSLPRSICLHPQTATVRLEINKRSLNRYGHPHR